MLKRIYDNGGKYLVYFLLFNLVFLIFALSTKYALPFIISALLSIWLQPLAELIHKKTKLNKSFVNLLCITFSVLIAIGIVFLIGTGMLRETKEIIKQSSTFDLNNITQKISDLKVYIEEAPPDMVNAVTSKLEVISNSLIGYAGTVANFIIKAVSLIPTSIINGIIIIISTFYIMRDYKIIVNKFDSLKTGKSDLPKQLLKRANFIIINYIQSYSVLLSITFIEAVAVFTIFDIKYKFTLAILCVILDILPIIGTAIIYIPIALIFLLQGKVAYAIWIIALYSLFIVIRHVLEPKLLSKSLEIHPVLILMSVYIGLSVYGILGIIYCIFLIAYFKILREMEII